MEGFFDCYVQANGWSRSITLSGRQYIGWWQDGLCNGNGKWLKADGTVEEEGWFKDGEIRAPYRVQKDAFGEEVKESSMDLQTYFDKQL